MKNFVVANVRLFALVAFMSLLDIFLNDVFWLSVIPILVFYTWACVALGRLASCFGQSASSWAFSAFLLYPIELALAFFAFFDGVHAAYADPEEEASPDGAPLP